MSELLTLDIDLPDMLVGAAWARGVQCVPSPAPLRAELGRAVASVVAEEVYPPPDLKKSVRDLLRTRGYKPAGRGKPASEYLAGVARKGEFPSINVLVDINNLVSLESGLPISVLDRGRFGAMPVLRFGREGERYVFNPSGQEIDLKGLMVVCDGEIPRGTPVKDSMATKVGEETSEVLAVIYGTRAAHGVAQMQGFADRFGALLSEHAGAEAVEVAVLSGQ